MGGCAREKTVTELHRRAGARHRTVSRTEANVTEYTVHLGNTFTQASSAIFSRHARDGNLNGTFKLPLLVCQMRTYILRDDIQFDKKKMQGYFNIWSRYILA